MDLLELVELLELGTLEQPTSYATPLKLVALGHAMQLTRDTRVVDFGCGKADALVLWGRLFDVSGIGIERNETFCEIAMERIHYEGLAGQLRVVCADATGYSLGSAMYDVACCIGASFIWGGFHGTLRALREATHDNGQVVIGEPTYQREQVPQELVNFEGEHHTEPELLEIMHEEGFDLKAIFRASDDDRDRYTAFWDQHGQEMYLKYMRPYEGWAMYLMAPSGVGPTYAVSAQAKGGAHVADES